MFDNFLASLKSQTSQFSSSFHDLRYRLSSTANNSVKRSNTIIGYLGSSSLSDACALSGGDSSNSVSDASQQSLKWPGNGNKSRWRSSSSLVPSKAISSHIEENQDLELETVFRNPTHNARDESDDEEEPCLIDKFDRALASVQSREKGKNDREEIRRRLALGIEADEFEKKPNVYSRLLAGKNLQICFMNETASDGSDSDNHLENHEETINNSPSSSNSNGTKPDDSDLPLALGSLARATPPQLLSEIDFLAYQTQLQIEARAALARVKDVAQRQMQVERQKKKGARISDLVRQRLEKLGIPFPWDCRRLSRQILMELNIAQLQVIVNDLHTQIEELNEELVLILLQRDDNTMEQDSMLVDIEDVTRYLTAKYAALESVNASTEAALHVQETPTSISTKRPLNQSLARIPGLRK